MSRLNRTAWSGAIRSARHSTASFFPAMGAVLAGQYAEKRAPFLIDFSIRAASIPRVSYVDVLRGDEATLDKLRDKKVIIGGTALELGDRFSIPNGGVVSGPVLQTLAAESILQNRTLHFTSDVVTLVGLCIIALIMMLSWRRLSAGVRVIVLVGMAAAVEVIAVLLQANFPLILDTSLLHTAIVVYMTAIALDEIDFRDLLSRIAESRFQRIAMSLGDGLVCTDQDHRITVWNPGAVAIFGYDPAEMIGRPFETICAGSDDVAAVSSAVGEAARARSQSPGGLVVEFEGPAQERRGVSRSRPASPAGKAPTASSTARSCATYRCENAKPKEFAIWPNTIPSPGSPTATAFTPVSPR